MVLRVTRGGRQGLLGGVSDLSNNDVTYEALKSASFMALNHYPNTKEAGVLCSLVIEDILETEERKVRRRATDLANFKEAVRLIISDLMVSLTPAFKLILAELYITEASFIPVNIYVIGIK